MVDVIKIHEPTVAMPLTRKNGGLYEETKLFNWSKIFPRKGSRLSLREATILGVRGITSFIGEEGLELIIQDDIGYACLIFLYNNTDRSTELASDFREEDQRIAVYRDGTEVIGISKMPKYR